MMARPIEKESFIEIPWDLLSFRGEFSQATEFTPFPRLPPEIRCKIVSCSDKIPWYQQLTLLSLVEGCMHSSLPPGFVI